MCAAVLSVLAVSWPHQQAKAQPGMSVSFQMFYDELSPYGQWIDDPEYGYVWAPEVDNDFRPYYTSGRWMMTDYGNTWISDYDWGWAPFHYGRWTYDNWYGWVWIPGDQWGPAWVTWRQGGGYYGWAPMGPGLNINMSFGNYYTPYDWWTFIPYGNIYSPNWNSYWRGPRYNTTIINQTTIINNYHNNRYVYGPRRSDLERHVGRVNVYQLRDNRNPGRAAVRRNEVAIYRPQVVSNERRGFREAPRQVVRAERPIGDRNGIRDNDRSTIERGRDMNRMEPGRSMNSREQRFDRREIENGRIDRGRTERIMERQDVDRSQQMMQAERERNMGAERMRSESIRAQREQEMVQRQQEQRVQVERQRMDRENELRGQREMIAQRENDRRVQYERERAARENVQRMEVERARQDQMRQQEMRNRQQMMEQRQQEQRLQMERQQQMQAERQQQMQRVQMERQQQMQQREWRRPEPQMQPQRIERPSMDRGNPSGERPGRRR